MVDEYWKNGEWSVSEKRPGYRVKTVHNGNVTYVIYRPILTEEEANRRDERILDCLEAIARMRRERERRKARGERDGRAG